MSAASNYLETALLNHTLRYGTSPYVAPTTLYVALFIGSASANLELGTLTDEVPTAGSTSYARQVITFNAATGTNPTYCANTSTITFPTCTTTAWGTITTVAITNSATRGAGDVLFYGTVTTSKTIDVGDTFQISATNLTIALA
jgi:hypothetical protein